MTFLQEQIQYSPVILIFIASSLCALGVTVRIYLDRNYMNSTGLLSLLTLLMALWAAGMAGEISLVNLDMKMILIKICYVSYALVPTIWFIYLYTEILKYKKFAPFIRRLLFAVPLITMFFAFSNLGNLFYKETSSYYLGEAVMIDTSYGPVFFLHAAYSLLMSLITVVMLVGAKNKKSINNRQLIWLIAGTLTPIALSVIYLSGLVSFDITSLGFVVSSLAILAIRPYIARLPVASEVVFDSMSDGVIIVSSDDRLLKANDPALAMLGISKRDMQHDLVPALYSNFPIYDEDGSLLKNVRGPYELPDGSRRHYNLLITKLNELPDKSTGILFIIQDDVRFKEAQTMLDYLEHFDNITGLPNRFMFIDQLQSEIARADSCGSQIALIALNINRFRELNDIYGIEFGDLVLSEFGDRLKTCIRQVDMCARFSSDEFYLMLPSSNPNDGVQKGVEAVMNRILNTIAKPIRIKDVQVEISIRAGVAVYPQDVTTAFTPDLLMALAASAMEEARTSGKNKYSFFSSTLRENMEMKFSLSQDLASAVENEQLFIEYQPQINTRSTKVFGVEALLRWQHPMRGVIQPSEFIPIAEENGSIVKIGYWLFEQACAQLVSWTRIGISDLTMSVNLSVRQIHEEAFAKEIIKIARGYEVDPGRIELEITESIAIDYNSGIHTQLDMLRDFGFRLAIDDFAMGHSSFLYLKQFNVNTLKVDKVLSASVETDPTALAVIRALCIMCSSLDVALICEFVESKHQLELLIEQGCDLFQGFFFAKPLSPKKCLEFICEFNKQERLPATKVLSSVISR